jgi:hypothetical protein
MAFDATAVTAGARSIEAFENCYKGIKFEDIIQKMKQAKNMPVEDIINTFSKELEILSINLKKMSYSPSRKPLTK